MTPVFLVRKLSWYCPASVLYAVEFIRFVTFEVRTELCLAYSKVCFWCYLIHTHHPTLPQEC